MDAITHNNDATGAPEALGHRFASNALKYPEEEVVSSRKYNSAYEARNLHLQCLELKRVFPHISPGTLCETRLPLYDKAEAWFAIPRWEVIAGTYSGAVTRVLECLSERSGHFLNHRREKLGSDVLRQRGVKLAAFEKALIGGDVYLIPAQFGLRHCGRSPRWVREMLVEREFPLGAFEVAIMLLTHPERLTGVNDIWIACAGDEYDEDDTQASFQSCLYFYSARGPLELGAELIGEERERIGIPTGFSL